MSLTKKEAKEFLAMLDRMPDDRVRYFYMMLGDAIANGTAVPMPMQSNTGPAQLAELEARLRAS
jgi:hypothetical protein